MSSIVYVIVELYLLYCVVWKVQGGYAVLVLCVHMWTQWNLSIKFISGLYVLVTEVSSIQR